MKIQTCFAIGKEKYRDVHVSKPFVTAIIDPDWPYTVAPGMKSVDDIEDAHKKGRLSGFTRNKDEGQNQYKQKRPLSIKEMKNLPVPEVVAGYVFLWTTGPFLINGAAKEILDAWGFEPSSIMTWAKFNKERHIREGRGEYGGVGFWFLGNAEFCIVAKKNGFPSIRTGRSSLLIEPKGRHSAKPDNVHALCEERFPGPYIELFARKRRAGWHTVGSDIDGGDVGKELHKLARADTKWTWSDVDCERGANIPV
jgi:N6-adenosine-specific RNA methylase IME4